RSTLSSFADPTTFPSVFETFEADARETTPTVVPAEETVTEDATFAELGLPRKLVRALTREGIIQPFEIQSATIPDALAGRDVLGRGQTGSGKTLAFGLPLLARGAQGGR